MVNDLLRGRLRVQAGGEQGAISAVVIQAGIMEVHQLVTAKINTVCLYGAALYQHRPTPKIQWKMGREVQPEGRLVGFLTGIHLPCPSPSAERLVQLVVFKDGMT